jgi:Membrane bound beta barrel domain (DUF5777)
MIRHFLIALIATMVNFTTIAAQDTDLLGLLDDEKVTNYAEGAFKSPHIINAKSMEMLPRGVLDFRILHRFGPVSGGFYELFGLDQASMRMSFDYGFTKNMIVGIGRSTNRKELDAYFKYRLLWQSSGERNMPISLVGVAGITYSPLRGVEVSTNDRMGYFFEAIVGRKFSDRFSLQLMPNVLIPNQLSGGGEPDFLVSTGIGTRFKLTKRIAITADHYLVLNRDDFDWEDMPLSIGVDIETGGHVFQLHFSNATGMNTRAVIQDPNLSWAQGEIRFGFNLSRWFQVQKNR